MTARILLGLWCFFSVGTGAAQIVTPLDGVYERVSLTNTSTGNQLDAGQKGLMIIAHGYYSMMTINPDRPKLERGQRMDDLPEAEQITFM